MYTVLAAFGSRPEAIKIAPLLEVLRQRPSRLDVQVVVSGEQRPTLDHILELFGVPVDIDLGLGDLNGDRAAILALAVSRLSSLMERQRPSLVLVVGDAVTSLAATMAAYYHRIPVAHVEAGLRTGDKFSTFPEEGHRLMISSVADLHFAPTEESREHLLREGKSADAIFVTGNPGIDALHWVCNRLERMRAEGTLDLAQLFGRPFGPSLSPAVLDAIRRVDRGEARLVLISGSRPENFGEHMQSICGAVSRLAAEYPDCVFLYPSDLREALRAAMEEMLRGHDNVFVLPPLEYPPFVYLMSRCHFVLTDSGVIQEEAPSLGKPVLVMRQSTDRPEALAAGAVKLVGSDAIRIVTAARRLLDDEIAYHRMGEKSGLYGDGLASERIADLLEKWALEGPLGEVANAG